MEGLIRIRLGRVPGRREKSGSSQRQPHFPEGKQEFRVSQQTGLEFPVEAVGGGPGSKRGHDGQASSLQTEEMEMYQATPGRDSSRGGR